MVDLQAMGYEAKCYELAGLLLSCDTGINKTSLITDGLRRRFTSRTT